MHRKRIPNYHTLKYCVSPISFYDAFVLHSALNNIAEHYLRRMDYGEYMDTGDGLGYDDIEPYNYGYDETLSGFFSSVWKIAKGAGSAISKSFQFAKKYAVKGWDFTKKWTVKGWQFAKKLPSYAGKGWQQIKSAGQWTYGKIIKPTAKWTKGAVKDVYYWKGWRPIGNTAYKIIGGTISTGLQIIDALGQAFIMTAGGQIYPAPTGTTPTPQPTQATQPPPQSSIYPPSPKTEYEYITSPDTGEYLPVNIDSGWVVDPATGQPVREATEAELTLAKDKKKNIWWYIVGGLGIASLLI